MRETTKPRCSQPTSGKRKIGCQDNRQSRVRRPVPYDRNHHGGVSVTALIDTGSEVTTVTERWFRRHFRSSDLNSVHWITRKGANGVEIPYAGIAELDVTIADCDCGVTPILVVKGSSDPGTVDIKEQTPALLGMNVLERLPGGVAGTHSRSSNWLRPIVSQVSAHRKATRAIGRVAGSVNVHIPAGSLATVHVTGPTQSATPLIAEQGDAPLTGGLILVPTLVGGQGGERHVRLLNMGKIDVTLRPHTQICVLHPIREVRSDEGIVFTTNGTIQTVTLETTEKPREDAGTTSPPAQNDDADKCRRLRELLERHNGVFAETDDNMGYTDAVQHRIPLPDDVPVAQPYRSIPHSQYAEVREHIKGLLRNNIIRESHSPYAAPIVVVRKKDGSIRLWVDYRRLNAKTIRDAYPLPRIEESFDALAGARYFSTLDLVSGYHQIAVDSFDRHKTAFVTTGGYYEYNRVLFGLNNSGATFQRLMRSTLSDDLFDCVLIYLDNILVFSKTFDEHFAQLDRVLTKIAREGLTLKTSKCRFLRQEVTYLGHEISAEGVACESDKADAVRNWPTPTTGRELRSFIGFVSYYRRFIKGFSQIAGPLHDVVNQTVGGKNNTRRKPARDQSVTDKWASAHQSAFTQLKAAVTS